MSYRRLEKWERCQAGDDFWLDGHWQPICVPGSYGSIGRQIGSNIVRREVELFDRDPTPDEVVAWQEGRDPRDPVVESGEQGEGTNHGCNEATG